MKPLEFYGTYPGFSDINVAKTGYFDLQGYAPMSFRPNLVIHIRRIAE